MTLTTHPPRSGYRIRALLFTALLPLALVSCSDDRSDEPETVAADTSASNRSESSNDKPSESKNPQPNPAVGSEESEESSEQTQQPEDQPKEPAKGKCIWSDVDHATYQPGTDNLVSKYCDGRWAIVGRYGSEVSWV